uniref:Uncharacterized protein n=2 Tax=Oryza glumipatula TaxID=40148 RepID=A0A0D9ZW45_9ORYZ
MCGLYSRTTRRRSNWTPSTLAANPQPLLFPGLVFGLTQVNHPVSWCWIWPAGAEGFRPRGGGESGSSLAPVTKLLCAAQEPPTELATMELVTGAMESLLPKLCELLKEEYGLQRSVREKVRSLSRELEVVRAVLRKIGDVPSDQLDEQVRLWVRDVREASYQMEDIVDTFLVRDGDDGPENTDSRILQRLRKKISKLFKKMKARRMISSLIQDINEKLQEVAARHGWYTVDNIDLRFVPATTIDPRLHNLYKRATELVGIDGPRDDVINKLSLGGDVDVADKKMKIISIVGFGGLGKTTLAKAVYDHFKPHFKRRVSVPADQDPDMNKIIDDQVKPHFECGAFVPVGRNPDMKKVFRDILIDLDKEKYMNSNIMVLDEKQLMDEINEFVKEKRCFIVIDDIWNRQPWNLIKCALQESDCGSRLIITTRIYEVATHAGEVYKIQPLSRDNSEKLLLARIVDGEGKYFNNPSAEACEIILKKCGGVPLAIITIASLFASKPGEDWSEVYNSIGFGHEDNDDVDHVIEKNSLIWKWIAEGFIHEEQAAEVGLFELGERNFQGALLADVTNCRESEITELVQRRSLLHLRYLGVVHTYITELPREVRYLKFLQTLDLWGTHIEELPEEVGLLTQLLCLRANEGTRVPSLGNLHNIRDLHIGGSPLHEGRTTDARSISYQHLQFLWLKCFMFSGLPAWIESSLAPNLSYLYVDVLVVKEQDMETLARLPELRRLILHSYDTKLISIKIRTEGVCYFRKLRILSIDGIFIWFDLHGSGCNIRGNNSLASLIMPSLESLDFIVHVRFLKDATQLSFGKLLGFENYGRSSLQKVTMGIKCGGARTSEIEEVVAAFMNSAAVHPKHPTVQTKWLEEEHVLSPYQEACMDVSRTCELVNKAWKANIVSSGHIRALHMPDPAASPSKVVSLLYRRNGKGLLVLSSNAIHMMWKWESSDENLCGMSNASVPPQLWQPESGIVMTNESTNGNPEEAVAFSALSKNGSYLISASGGKVSLFNLITFETMTTFMAPPPSATFLAFHPQDNSIMAIGMEDSSTLIYNVRVDDVSVKTVLKGHQKKITGLAFSLLMNLCVWSTDGWAKKKSRYIQPPSNRSGALAGDTMVQFHYDQKRLLVVHESQLAIYDLELECLCLWSPSDPLPAPVSSAVYSSDGILIYAGFCDGAIGIFEEKSLMLQCRIAPSAYIPSSVSSGGGIVYPMAVAAHPWKPNQFAVGMSDGEVHVLEPLDTHGRRDSGERCRPMTASTQ